ncbi:MAG: hypothetical protein MZU95_02745 [Desulfomicrobium escambiense]|nr:hypothetical protein [Desulfomicrobium escambiense]
MPEPTAAGCATAAKSAGPSRSSTPTPTTATGTYNQENNPYAVVGLQTDHIGIEDIRLDAGGPQLQDLREGGRACAEISRCDGGFTYGAYILDPDRRSTIGVWYSSLNAGIKVNPETNVVSISDRHALDRRRRLVSAAGQWRRDRRRVAAAVGIGVGCQRGLGGGSSADRRLGFWIPGIGSGYM